MVDRPENILVDFEYNNVLIVDPNKVVDEFGKAKERLVKHENLVMYANLECKVIPRTKLLLGSSNTDNFRTISLASINFLNPGKKQFIDNSYTDEITGKGSLQGKGVNQPKINQVPSSKKSDDYYYTQQTLSDGKFGAVDNGLLGIKSISIRQGLDFEPVVTIKLEDVKGRALFESGNDSPYSAFFNLPYPLFDLTIKGYYGKALKLPMILQDFVADYNSVTGNFDITLTMYTYKYSVLGEISLGAIIATPHMYQSTVQIQPKTPSNTAPAGDSKVESNTQVVEYGYQKIKEVYSEYKTKGLIADDFPEITVVQMQKRLDQFIQSVLDSYDKVNLDALTNIKDYRELLAKYQGDVFLFNTTSWFNKYIDTKNYYVLKDKNKTKIYTFSKAFTDKKVTCLNELDKIIQDYNSRLGLNPTCGNNGSYKIGNNEVTCTITNGVNFSVFLGPEEVKDTDIDFEETFKVQKGDKQPAKEDIDKLKEQFNTSNLSQASSFKTEDGTIEQKFSYFVFTGPNSFMDITDKMFKELETKRVEIETALTNQLANTVNNKNNGLGFVPTLRNVLAVVFASGEAFVRLLDEVHNKAWNQRDSPIRKAPIFKKSTAGANKDALNQGDAVTTPIYPWPEFLIETAGENGQEKFVHKYPGASDVINETKAFLFDQWPEVEFVEEFMRAITQKQNGSDENPSDNPVKDNKRVSVSAIEFPTNNEIFNNKEEVKFFFEIYERLILSSFYSKLLKTTDGLSDFAKISAVVAEAEKNNIITSLAGQNPFLKEKFANYGFNENNFLAVMRQFSNQGVGESWQNYIRGIFNTPYIKNLVNNSSFTITNLEGEQIDVMGQSVNSTDITNTTSFKGEEDLSDYFTGSTYSNVTDITDLYPFIEKKWDNNNMGGFGTPIQSPFGVLIPPPPTPIKEYYDTTKILNYNHSFKVVANFDGSSLTVSTNNEMSKPFSSYNFQFLEMTSTSPQTATQSYLDTNDLTTFYTERINKPDKQLPTEGELIYRYQPALLPSLQTISMLNTPFFTNSIQEGVSKFRAFNPYPYVVPAFLFLNSLPISTLRERYTKYLGQQEGVEYSNYIAPTLKKFASIHRMPLAWVLKLGSVWHRYKTWVKTGVDILDETWKSFDYVANFDPSTSAYTKTYSLTLDGNQNVDIVLEKNTTIGTQTYTQLNTGFYPETIDDFNVFYQGYKLFNGYTSTDVQNAITSGLTLINSSDANITVDFGKDPFDANRYVQSNAWSVYVETFDKQDCFILPSHGSSINQAQSECISPDFDDLMIYELAKNKSVYNGSVRSFWNAPTYGYFDVDAIRKPSPDEYLKKVVSQFVNQENFSIRGVDKQLYSNISEIFSVFDSSVLDIFENKFLEFSKPKYNYTSAISDATDSQQNYGNFQLLFTSLMKVPAPETGLTPNQVIKFLQTKQVSNFASTIKGFLSYDVLIKNGNPTSFDRKLFYSFSDKLISEPYVFTKYSVNTPNALPSSAGTQTLVSSKLNYPNSWAALLEYVGFTELEKIQYTDTGSTIFDFFIDFDIAFEPENIKLAAPIIKMYATQKFLGKSPNSVEFKKLMNLYLEKGENFLNKVLNLLFTKVGAEIGDVKIEKNISIASIMDGEQSKLELYETFKAINDKWISGADYKNKTFLEDVLILDRANRNIGDIVVVDIFKLRDYFTGQVPETTNMLTVVRNIISENNFQIMTAPAFVNYYNVQEVSKNALPKPENTSDLANTLFGTFLNVDYKNSSTKMICLYGGKPSTQLDIRASLDNFKNDAFDLRRASDNPLIENQTNKKDWGVSNKVVGFNVDMGPQNQGVFKTFSVSQKNSTPTAESLQIISEMGRQAGNRGSATQNLSLYDLYKVRSYDCEVTMLGNALIQPMMYFNLRYVPMFSGPYMITSVNHEIKPGDFGTRFTGIRQPIANYDVNLNFLQTLRTNLVQKIITKKEEELQKQRAEESKNQISNAQGLANNSLNTTEPKDSAECSAITKYNKYVKIDGNASKTQVTPQEVKELINDKASELGISTAVLNKLKYAVFANMYLNSYSTNNFVGYENNYTAVDLTSNWANSETYFSPSKKFFCGAKKDKILPYVVFDSAEKNIEMFLQRWRNKSSLITAITDEEIGRFVTTNNTAQSVSLNTWYTLNETDKGNILNKVQGAINLYDSLA